MYIYVYIYMYVYICIYIYIYIYVYIYMWTPSFLKMFIPQSFCENSSASFKRSLNVKFV